MATSVSVVIPARNDADSLAAAVESALNQQISGQLEVVIAVGPSKDGTEQVAADLARDLAQVRVVKSPSGRTPSALNLAIAATTYPVVARVDARSVLPTGYLKAALETIEQTGAANVGAIQFPVGLTPRQRSIAAAMRSRLGSGGAAYRGTNRVRRADTGYLGVFRREPLVEVGCFDEHSIRNQDAELNLRLRNAGHEVWVDPRLVVRYLPRSSLVGLAQQYWQYGWWRRRTATKHPGSLRIRQLLPPVAVLGILVSTIGAVFAPWLLVVPLSYLVLLALAGAVAADLSLSERVLVPVALALMHFAWAFGFAFSSLQRRKRRSSALARD